MTTNETSKTWTIMEALQWSDEQIKNLTDEEIKEAAYGIKYFEPDPWGPKLTAREWAVMGMLEQRLKSIEAKPKPKRLRAEPILCGCGHYDNHPMSTSLGTSCANCYDEMSC